MACVAELQPSVLQVQSTDKSRDKSDGGVVVAQDDVHLLNDCFGCAQVSERGTEQVDSGGHEQRGRHALAAYVADDEPQFVVTEAEVVQVTAHFQHRYQVGVHHNTFVLREMPPQDTHLYGVGNAHLVFQNLFFGFQTDGAFLVTP